MGPLTQWESLFPRVESRLWILLVPFQMLVLEDDLDQKVLPG